MLQIKDSTLMTKKHQYIVPPGIFTQLIVKAEPKILDFSVSF